MLQELIMSTMARADKAVVNVALVESTKAPFTTALQGLPSKLVSSKRMVPRRAPNRHPPHRDGWHGDCNALLGRLRSVLGRLHVSSLEPGAMGSALHRRAGAAHDAHSWVTAFTPTPLHVIHPS